MSKGILCDVDGTLVDSNDYHAYAWQEAFREAGFPLRWEELRNQIGKGGDQLIPYFLTPEQISALGEKIEKRKDQIYKKKYIDQVKGLPGVHPFFERLHSDRKKAVLATSGGTWEIQHYLRILGIEKWIRDIISSDDVARSKPYPDLFHLALDRFHWNPSDAVILADTPYDVLAGNKLGLQTIAVLTGGFTEKVLKEAGASEIYKDLPDLLKRYESSRLSS